MTNESVGRENETFDVSTKTYIDIPFHDVDSMKIVWHGYYVKYLEIARCELLELINYNYDVMSATGFGWPITDVRIKYIKPIAFKQQICVESTLVEWEHRIKINYIVSDVLTGERLTKAHTTQMAVNTATGETLFESPDVFFQLLREFKKNA